MIPPEKLEMMASAFVGSLQDQNLPREIGVAVFVFQYGENQGVGFASTAKRPQMVEVIRNWLRRQTIEVFRS